MWREWPQPWQFDQMGISKEQLEIAVKASGGDLEIYLKPEQAIMLLDALDAISVLEAFRELIKHRIANPEDSIVEPIDPEPIDPIGAEG